MWIVCGSCNCVMSIICILDYDPACGMCNPSDCNKIHSYCLPVMCSILLQFVLSTVSGISLQITDMLCMIYVLSCKVGLSFI